MKLVKIPISQLKHMQSLGFIELTPYVHKNPLVRWIFWKRLKTILNFAVNEKAKRVLDFGAGSGIFMLSLAKYYKEVHSLDLNTKALEYLKKRYRLNNVKIANGNMNNQLPYRHEFFDIVIAADVLEHFKDSSKIQEEFKRVLKKNGCLIVSGPTENFIYQLARKYLYRRKKPADHYTNVDDVLKKSAKLFKIEKVKVLPFVFIPGFKIYKARKI